MSSKLNELAVMLLMNRPTFTRKDLAQRYNKSLRTIDNWHGDGTLPKAKHFHGPLWTPAQIIAAENQSKKLRKISA